MLDAATLEAITQEARQAFLEEDAPLCLTLLIEGLPKLELALQTDQSTEYCQPIYKTWVGRPILSKAARGWQLCRLLINSVTRWRICLRP